MTGPRHRRAGRVIVLAGGTHVLLLQGRDPSKPDSQPWWITPGGGLEPGESTADAARRELAEETGYDCPPLTGVVLTRSVQFDFDGVDYLQEEDFYLLRVDEQFAVDTSRHSAIELVTLLEPRWWPIEELRGTTAVIYPENLADLVLPAG